MSNEAHSTSSKTPPGLLSRPFRFYFRNFRKLFALGIVTLFFTNIFDNVTPKLIGMAIDQVNEQAPTNQLIKTLGWLVLAIVGVSVFRYAWRILWGRFHHTVGEDLRNRIFDHFTILGPSFFQKRPVGQLMSLITNDVNSFRMAIGPGVLILLDATFLLCIVPPMMFSMSPSWTWKTLILMPLIPFIIAKVQKIIHDRYRVQQDRFSDMSGSAQEIVSGVRVIKAYAQEKNHTRLFNRYSRRFEDACNGVAKVEAMFSPVMELGVTVGTVILMLVGAPEVMAGQVSVGDFFAFYLYIERMVWPMTAFGISFTFIQQGRASFNRVKEVLQTDTDIPDEGTRSVETFEKLEVKNLTFTYPGETSPALRNVSFTLRRGETLGIVGPTGSGKSTLIDLLSRLYPADSGEIKINDVPISEIPLNQLRRLLAIVPQEAFLFSEKVRDNIAMDASKADFDEVRRVVELVNLEYEIESMPFRYDSYLGERGVNLSGGQKQRLTIARALIRNSPVVVLDDSLSAVDANTERRILNNLRGELKSRNQSLESSCTTIIISHRLVSMINADKIVVLNDGTIEAQGTYLDLLKTSPTLQKISALQNPEDPVVEQ